MAGDHGEDEASGVADDLAVGQRVEKVGPVFFTHLTLPPCYPV